MSVEEGLQARYPGLFAESVVRWGTYDFHNRFSFAPARPELTSNVRFCGFSGEAVLLITTREFGPSAFPGGTLEPGESVEEGLARELAEEAGARALGFIPFGHVHFRSDAPAPFRPHVPHPEFQWIVGYGDVEIFGEPTNPADGEHVIAVEMLDPGQAEARLRESGQDWQADLLAVTVEVRSASMLDAS